MASVLKSSSESNDAVSAARKVSGLAGFNLDDLAGEGQKRLEQCRQKVAEMLAKAESDAIEIRKQAASEGYEEGLKRAAVDADTKLKKEADRRAKEGLRLIESAMAQTRETYQQWMVRYAEILNRMSLSAAERVVRAKLEKEPDIILNWASEAVMSTRSASRLSVAVHPETLADLG